MKIVAVVVLAMVLFVVPCQAEDGLFVAYEAGVLIPEDDNFGIGKGFLAQGCEVGYSWKYIELGCEWFISNLKTLHASTFTDSSVIGQVKVKYPLPFKWVNRLTPYAVVGVGSHFFVNKDLKDDPDQPDSEWNRPESIGDSGLALKYGAGVQYRLTERISLFGEAAYRYGDEGKGSSIAVYSWSYQGGVRVRF